MKRTLPGGSDFYQVEVTHRGKVTIDADTARAKGAELTLGQPGFR